MPVESLIDGTRIPTAETGHVFNPPYRGSNVLGKVAGKAFELAGASSVLVK